MLSGVNHGANLGEDVTYSGTIAAAMEATLFKVPAIALSQVCADGQPVKWATAEQHRARGHRAPAVQMPWPKDVLINVNFPDLRRRTRCRACGSRPRASASSATTLLERTDPRGEPYVWIGGLRVEEASAGRAPTCGGRRGLYLGHPDPHGHDPSRQLRAAAGDPGVSDRGLSRPH